MKNNFEYNSIQQQIKESFEKAQKEIDKLYVEFFKRHSEYISTQKDIDLVKASIISNDMYTIANEAGLTEVLEKFADQFKIIKLESLKFYKQFKIDDLLNQKNLILLEESANRSVIALNKMLQDKMILPLQTNLYNNVFANAPIESIITSQITVANGLKPKFVLTEVENAYHVFSQQTIELKAQELELEIYIYSGVQDEKTSPQCNAILNGTGRLGVAGMWYRDEINNDMVDGITSDDVFLQGGHYNCRHVFYPITKEYAEDLGATLDDQD